LSLKVCVTGGAGMIGSSLVRALSEAGHTVTVIDSLWRGRRRNLVGIDGFDPDASLHVIDLADPHHVASVTETVRGSDVVVHLADIVAGISYVFDNQYDIFRVNNAINSNLFHACAEAGVERILYAGTACSFPKDLQSGLTSVLREDQMWPAQPESAYGWSKLAGTLELEYLAERHGTKVCTLVLHNVYGPNCDIEPGRSQVIPALIRRIMELSPGEVLTVWGSGNQGRAFVYVDDVVDAFLAALDRPSLPPLIQIGPPECTSIKALVRCLLDDVFRHDVEVHWDTSKPEGDLGRCADNRLARETLGWKPRTPLAEGLERTAAWIRREMAQLA
jgi:GDP-D-mannose 3', 5'-epimerase